MFIFNLSEDEFVELVSKTLTVYDKDYNKSSRPYRSENPSIDSYLYHEWSYGGIKGGSCWESSDPQEYFDDEVDDKFNDLDEIIFKIYPSIPYLLYKKFENIIYEDSYTDYEYYGNCTYYKYKCVSLKNLYKTLTEISD